MDESEELEQIEGGKTRHVEPLGGGPRMAQHRRLAQNPGARLGRRQCLNRAIRGEPQRLVKAGDEDGGPRHQHPPLPGSRPVPAVGHDTDD